MKKNMLKISVSWALIIALVMTTMMPIAASTKRDVSSEKLLSDYLDEKAKTRKQVFTSEGSTYYVLSTPEFAYCSQLIGKDRLQFSYYSASTGTIHESEIYTLAELYDELKAVPRKGNGEIDEINEINELIISNVDVPKVRNLYTQDSMKIRSANLASSNPENYAAAVETYFGADYTNRFVDSETWTYRGQNYQLNCRERQSTSIIEVDSSLFSEDTAITTILTWMVFGEWSWVGIVKKILTRVALFVVREGAEYLAKDTVIEKIRVECVRTRTVTVEGTTNPIYYAAQEIRSRVAVGSEDGTVDGDDWENTHSDFFFPELILENAWTNYRDYVLN